MSREPMVVCSRRQSFALKAKNDYTTLLIALKKLTHAEKAFHTSLNHWWWIKANGGTVKKKRKKKNTTLRDFVTHQMTRKFSLKRLSKYRSLSVSFTHSLPKLFLVGTFCFMWNASHICVRYFSTGCPECVALSTMGWEHYHDPRMFGYGNPSPAGMG